MLRLPGLLYAYSAENLNLSEGDPVETWPNYAPGSFRDMIPASSPSTYLDSGLGQKPSVFFQSSSLGYRAEGGNVWGGSSAQTIYAVVSHSGSGSNKEIISYWNSSLSRSQVFKLAINGTQATYAVNSISVAQTDSGTAPEDTPVVLCARFLFPDIEVRINGEKFGQGSALQSFKDGQGAIFRIGHEFSGLISAIFLYDERHETSTVALAESYLKEKYSI
jgi:hypothetical protein